MDLQHIVVTDICKAFTVHSAKGRHESMQDRACYGLSLCKSGKITYVQNGKEFVSEPNTAVLLPAGGSYLIRRDKTGDFPVINFTCAEPISDLVSVIRLQGNAQLLHDFKLIKQLLPNGHNRTKVLSIFYDMLHQLSISSIPSELAPALRLIDTSYRDPGLTNATLARACNISEVYFRKRFTTLFHLSPKQYVIGIRIQNAKQLLSEGNMKIAAIAEYCGFASTYHFCRIFKGRVGVSPSDYRKHNHTL